MFGGVVERVLHRFAHVLKLARKQRDEETLQRETVDHAVNTAHVADDGVELPEAAQSQPDGGGHRVRGEAERFEDGEPHGTTYEQIGQVVYELVAGAPTGARKAELFVARQAVGNAKPKVGNYENHGKDDHPAQVVEGLQGFGAKRGEEQELGGGVHGHNVGVCVNV